MAEHRTRSELSPRRGIVILLTAGFMLIATMLAAVAIDIGYMALTKSQLQAATDSAALAGGTDLAQGLGIAATLSPSATQSLAQTSAMTMAANNRAGDVSSVYCNPTRDIRFGNAIYNNGSNTWTMSWGTAPYNLIGVTLLRNQTGSTSGDGPLPLFFSGLVGASSNLNVTASAALMPSNTIQITGGLTSTLMPLTVDKTSWDALMNGTGPDSYNYHTSSNTVTNGADGIKEVDLYPSNSGAGASRGLLDLGAGNSASADGAQIQNGVTAAQLASAGFPNGLTATASSPATISGTPGMKASLKDDLTAIIGEPRTVAVFESTSGSNYLIVKFVGLRIVNVDMTGNTKHVWAQPATVVDATYVPTLDQVITEDSVFSPVVLVQ